MRSALERAVRAILIGLLMSGGCARPKSDRPATYAVSGTLLVNGKPAAGARIRLYAIDDMLLEGVCPHAEVETDGSFTLTSFRSRDGAPVGKYALTVTWPSPPPPGKEEGRDRFRGRYGDRRRPVRQVEVTPGDNVLEPVRLP
jgi:hypothetical protein